MSDEKSLGGSWFGRHKRLSVVVSFLLIVMVVTVLAVAGYWWQERARMAKQAESAGYKVGVYSLLTPEVFRTSQSYSGVWDPKMLRVENGCLLIDAYAEPLDSLTSESTPKSSNLLVVPAGSTLTADQLTSDLGDHKLGMVDNLPVSDREDLDRLLLTHIPKQCAGYEPVFLDKVS